MNNNNYITGKMQPMTNNPILNNLMALVKLGKTPQEIIGKLSQNNAMANELNQLNQLVRANGGAKSLCYLLAPQSNTNLNDLVTFMQEQGLKL